MSGHQESNDNLSRTGSANSCCKHSFRQASSSPTGNRCCMPQVTCRLDRHQAFRRPPHMPNEHRGMAIPMLSIFLCANILDVRRHSVFDFREKTNSVCLLQCKDRWAVLHGVEIGLPSMMASHIRCFDHICFMPLVRGTMPFVMAIGHYPWRR